MTSEELLKKYICTYYKSVRQFAIQTGLKYSTIAAILTRGLNTASIDNVFEICDVLDIGVEALIKDCRIEPRTADLERQINLVSNDIEKYFSSLMLSTYVNDFMLDGKRLSDEEIEFLDDGINIVFNQLRARRKREESKKDFKKKMLEDQEEEQGEY